MDVEYPNGLSPDRWVNEYTCLACRSDDGSISVGDVYTIPTREVTYDTRRERFSAWVNKLLTPRNEYHNVHAEKDTVIMRVVDMSDTHCVLECIYTLKYYGKKPLSEYIS